jgi:hypothetical protein
VVISISLIISLILGGFDYIFTQSINLIGSNKNVQTIQNQPVAPVVTIAPLNPVTTTTIKPTVKPTIKK